MKIDNRTIYQDIISTTESFDTITDERKVVLQNLVDYIQFKMNNKQEIHLNFICTHNSRRSHLCHIWAQTAASFFQINSVYCYSGGTEVSAIFPSIIETLKNQGFRIENTDLKENSIYKIRFSDESDPINGFSKCYDDDANPKSNFAAIMTCSHADENCPIVIGSDSRIPIRYEDPKIYDGTPLQYNKYNERSLEIASEMFYVFSKLKMHE